MDKIIEEQMEQQIEATLDKIRPFLQREGGDITYIGFKDGVVYVQMNGACDGCAYAGADISSGVEIILMEEVPGVIKVEGTDIPEDVMAAYQAKVAAKKAAEEEK